MQPFTFFISYRREDTAPIALLLKYEIERRLQFVRVSVDVEEMRVGQLFPARIKRLIDQAHATIALIGKNWMPRRSGGRSGASKPATRPRGPDEDWVVTELMHSASSPIDYVEQDRYGLARRVILPIFIDCERRFDQFEIPAAIAEFPSVQAESIDYANWPVAIGPLIERIAVNLNLKKRPDADEYPKPDAAKARTQPLPDPELDSILKYEDYEGWYLDNFGNHHPEWRNVFNHVTVSLTTWDARRRVTIYDLNLALFMNKAARAVSARQ